jgi:hypothetical protein
MNASEIVHDMACYNALTIRATAQATVALLDCATCAHMSDIGTCLKPGSPLQNYPVMEHIIMAGTKWGCCMWEGK